MPKPRRPHVASPDEVKITRNDDYAEIVYADPKVASTSFRVGAEKLASMSDADLLDCWNDHVAATDEFIRTQRFTLTEIPPGNPQLERFEGNGQWVARGHVLRAVILTDSGIEPDLDEPLVSIDERDLTLREFAQMVGVFGGWGMRIAFVGDETVHEQPKIKVREPKEPKARSRKRSGSKAR